MASNTASTARLAAVRPPSTDSDTRLMSSALFTPASRSRSPHDLPSTVEAVCTQRNAARSPGGGDLRAHGVASAATQPPGHAGAELLPVRSGDPYQLPVAAERLHEAAQMLPRRQR